MHSQWKITSPFLLKRNTGFQKNEVVDFYFLCVILRGSFGFIFSWVNLSFRGTKISIHLFIAREHYYHQLLLTLEGGVSVTALGFCVDSR